MLPKKNPQSAKSPYTIAIYHQKGGVAKTTTTLSLSGALVEAGYRVLMIDLDPQASLTAILGIKPDGSKPSAVELLLGSKKPKDIVYNTKVPGLDFIPSNENVGLMESILPARNNYKSVLRRSIFGTQNYDFILLDCPTILGAVVVNAMNAAKRVIVPTQPEYLSIYALRDVLLQIKKLRLKDNPGLLYHILITIYDARSKIHKNLSEQLYSHFGDNVFRTIIQVDTKLRDAIVSGTPITHYAISTRGAYQYKALAEELIKYVEEEDANS